MLIYGALFPLRDRIFTQLSNYFLILGVAIQLFFLSLQTLLFYENLQTKSRDYCDSFSLWVKTQSYCDSSIRHQNVPFLLSDKIESFKDKQASLILSEEIVFHNSPSTEKGNSLTQEMTIVAC